MDLKKKMKAFFTLTRKADGGFTLVELIVVIAILGILGGVGVPAYSGYVKKANMQADMTLASEIEQALVLAHYSGKLNAGSTVIVHYGDGAAFDVKCSDESAEAAMIATFGANYEEVLRLKYEGWDDEMGVIADGAAYENVQQSMFQGDNLGYMLEDVQLLTKLFGIALTDQTVNITNTDFEAYLDELGLDKTDPTVVSNAATLYVANKISATANQTPAEGQISNKDAFVNAWCDYDLSVDSFRELLGNSKGDGQYDNSLQSSAAGYARAEALANYLDKQLEAQGYTGTYADSLRSSSTGIDPDAMINNGLNNLYVALEAVDNNTATAEQIAAVTAFSNYFGTGSESTSQAQKDAQAFLSYMDGVETSTDSLVKDTDLTVDGYYTDGEILSYVTSYLDIGKAFADAGYNGGGAFCFVYTGEGADPVKCAPLDY